TLSGDVSVKVTDDIPVLNSSANAVTKTVDEGGLRATDTHGSGNDSGNITVSGASGTGSGSLQPLVKFGADGPAATEFKIVDQTTATQWLNALNLKSHGNALQVASDDGHTLTVSDGTNPVFILTVNGDGSWQFNLQEPLDHPASSTVNNSLTIDLSGFVQGVDFDGDTVRLASGTTPSPTDGLFRVTVTDDSPKLTDQTNVSGSVDEGALVFSPAATASPGDLYGDGNDQGQPGVSTSSASSLSGLVSFGADGPAFSGASKDG